MNKKREELSTEQLPFYGEDTYHHASPGLFYVDSSFPGFGVDLDSFEGCSCGSHCKLGLCECLKTSSIESLSDLSLNYVDRLYPIFECHSLCSCDVTCVNKTISKGPLRRLCITPAGGKGLGVISQLNIPAGSFVCEYAGEMIGEEEAKRRIKRLRDIDHNYILLLREHVKSGTSDEKVNTTIIDATVFGNIGRYINHSCQPNLKLVPVRSESMIPNAALFAIKDIEAGEELSYCYDNSTSMPKDENASDKNVFHSSKTCLCFSSNCKKYLPLNYFL